VRVSLPWHRLPACLLQKRACTAIGHPSPQPIRGLARLSPGRRQQAEACEAPAKSSVAELSALMHHPAERRLIKPQHGRWAVAISTVTIEASSGANTLRLATCCYVRLLINPCPLQPGASPPSLSLREPQDERDASTPPQRPPHGQVTGGAGFRSASAWCSSRSDSTGWYHPNGSA